MQRQKYSQSCKISESLSKHAQEIHQQKEKSKKPMKDNGS